MDTLACSRARFPEVAVAAGHYESFYLKACAPGGGLGVWLRSTVLKPPGRAASASLWCTLFDAAAVAPVAVKQTFPAELLRPRDDGGLRIGESGFGADGLRGRAEGGGHAASWELALDGTAPPLAHLGGERMYRSPLPRTQLCSPRPAVRASGVVTIDGRRVELDGWPGMVGHNWGAQHAERWLWLQGALGDPDDGAWLDVAVARVRLGRVVTPWLATGALSLDGARHPLGGPGRWRGTRIAEGVEGCDFVVPGRRVSVRGTVRAARKDLVAWVYADPAGGDHDIVNCSIASISMTVLRDGRPPVSLACDGAAAYELGMREHDHGIPLQPFPDGPAQSSSSPVQ
jgi:hypothetical protein